MNEVCCCIRICDLCWTLNRTFTGILVFWNVVLYHWKSGSWWVQGTGCFDLQDLTESLIMPLWKPDNSYASYCMRASHNGFLSTFNLSVLEVDCNCSSITFSVNVNPWWWWWYLFDLVQHIYEVLRGHCWDEPFINLSATCLVRKYPDTTNCTGRIHWSYMFQFPKYVHTVTCLKLVHLDYTCISHYDVPGIWLSMNYYLDNCWTVNSWWICTMEDFLFYWTVTACMYCVLLKNSLGRVLSDLRQLLGENI